VTSRRLTLTLSCFLVALGLAPPRVAAQTCSAAVPAGSCTATTSTSMTVGTVLELSLTASATTLTPPATGDYDAGFVADIGPVATVKSNRAWTLKIAAASPFWTATNTTAGVTARTTKPAADLQWSTGAVYAGLTVAGTTLKSGAATAGNVTTILYHTLYSWVLDTPGAYKLVVVLTLSAP
jgi:hypothetical protein